TSLGVAAQGFGPALPVGKSLDGDAERELDLMRVVVELHVTVADVEGARSGQVLGVPEVECDVRCVHIAIAETKSCSRDDVRRESEAELISESALLGIEALLERIDDFSRREALRLAEESIRVRSRPTDTAAEERPDAHADVELVPKVRHQREGRH